MASSGPPGVNAPHPSLPARPPPSSSASASTAATAPPTSYGAPATTNAGPGPKLGYSRTYAPVGGTDAGRGRGGYTNTNSSYSNNSYTQPQTASYGPQYGAQYGATPAAGPQSYGPAAPHIQNPFPAAQGPQQPPSYQQQGYNAGRGGGGYRQNNTNAYAAGAAGPAAGVAAGTASYGPSYGPSGYGQSYGPSYGPSYGSSHGPSYGPTGPAYGAAAGAEATPTDPAAAGQEAPADEAETKKKTHTVYRSGGGKTWTDDSLLEWDPNHPRLFVGNLAGEVTDDTLFKAFAKWRSVQKALVKRDKWTKKSRGYGFVSFSDADDFFQAAKEMNGKYIGSHPVVVRKSTTDIKASSFHDESGGRSNDKRNNYNKHGKKNNYNNNNNYNNYNKSGGAGDSGSATHSGTSTPLAASGSGGAAGSKPAYAPALGPVSSGVQKTKKKTKNGLKLLG
ncbi:hypothetical protein SBRCBS47491_007226 [Sporothrix bragantina]|uniref:RRM domain-containing protein n=1 Tax=Sporothrix bragantina TaxID=671064 RepID=A0ABP0CCK1_9PEZI